MKTIDALGDLRGKRVLVRSDLNVPLDGDGRITDDGRIRAVGADDRRAGRGRRARGRRARTSAGRRARPRPKYSLRPVAARLGELLGRPVAFADRHGRAAPRRRSSPRSPTATSRCWRTCGSTPGRPARTTPSAAPSPTQLAALADAVRRRRLRRRAPQAGQRLRRRAAAAARRRRPRRHRGRGAAAAHRDPERPYAVVLGGSKVSRQARRHRQPAGRRPTGCSSAAAWSSRSSRPRATRSARACSRPTRSTRSRGYLERRGRARRRDRAAGRRRRRRRVLRRRRATTSSRADAIPADRMGLDIGPDVAPSCSPSGWPTRARSSGTARWACSRWRRSPRAPAPSPQALVDVTATGALTVVGGGDSAAAVRAARLRRRPRSATSRPAAAPAWSTSRARRCPGLAVLED